MSTRDEVLAHWPTALPPPEFVDGPHPEVVRWLEREPWPEDAPFPLTPLEAWCVMKGYVVAPKAGLTLEVLLDLPGKLEGGGKGPGGHLRLRE